MELKEILEKIGDAELEKLVEDHADLLDRIEKAESQSAQRSEDKEKVGGEFPNEEMEDVSELKDRKYELEVRIKKQLGKIEGFEEEIGQLVDDYEVLGMPIDSSEPY